MKTRLFWTLLVVPILLSSCDFQGLDDATAVDDPDSSYVEPSSDRWEGSFTSAFSADLSGKGSSVVGGIHVSDNSGTLEINGMKLDVVATERIPWSTNEGNYTLFQLLGPTTDGLYVAYVYCLGSTLNYVYFEGFDIAMASEPATGSCSSIEQAAQVSASLTAMKQLPSPQGKLASVDLHGDSVEINNGVGQVSVGGGMDAKLFGFVDCQDCPSSDGNGWLEFHSVLYNNFPSQVCFGILYLYTATSQLQLGWGFCLTDFSPLTSEAMGTVTWDM